MEAERREDGLGSCCLPATEASSWGADGPAGRPPRRSSREPHGRPCLPSVDTASPEPRVTGGYCHGAFPSLWDAGLCAACGWGVQQPVLGTPHGIPASLQPTHPMMKSQR